MLWLLPLKPPVTVFLLQDSHYDNIELKGTSGDECELSRCTSKEKRRTCSGYSRHLHDSWLRWWSTSPLVTRTKQSSDLMPEGCGLLVERIWVGWGQSGPEVDISQDGRDRGARAA